MAPNAAARAQDDVEELLICYQPPDQGTSLALMGEPRKLRELSPRFGDPEYGDRRHSRPQPLGANGSRWEV